MTICLPNYPGLNPIHIERPYATDTSSPNNPYQPFRLQRGFVPDRPGRPYLTAVRAGDTLRLRIAAEAGVDVVIEETRRLRRLEWTPIRQLHLTNVIQEIDLEASPAELRLLRARIP